MTLSNQELLSEKSRIPEWEYDSYSLVLKRVFLFSNFTEAISFVQKVSEKAEAQNHHPTILIEYNKVTLTLSTHDEGGVTEKDVALAVLIDTIN